MESRFRSRFDNVRSAILILAVRADRYECTRGLIWVHVRADMGPRARAVMSLESRAVSIRVTKHFVTIFVKHVISNVMDGIA